MKTYLSDAFTSDQQILAVQIFGLCLLRAWTEFAINLKINFILIINKYFKLATCGCPGQALVFDVQQILGCGADTTTDNVFRWHLKNAGSSTTVHPGNREEPQAQAYQLAMLILSR